MSLPPTFVRGFHDENQVKKMRYNVLGNTDMLVSHLGFGGAALAAEFYESYTEAEGITVLREALKKGVNFIDTAAFYGNGRMSETVIGKALAGVPREAFYIATKVGRYFIPETKMHFDFSYESTIRSVDESLKLLNLTYVDIIHAHDIEFAPSLDIIVNETLPALQEVVKAGKARYIGVTGYPISVLKEAIERSKVHVNVVLCYARSTLHDMTLLEYLPFFKERGVGVISAAAVAMGLLSNRGPFPWHPAHAGTKQLCQQAADYCKERGIELGKLAVSHSMSVPGPATHLLGMNNSTVLGNNLQVCIEGLNEIEKGVLQEIKSRFFSEQTAHHWEGVELATYQAMLADKAKTSA